MMSLLLYQYHTSPKMLRLVPGICLPAGEGTLQCVRNRGVANGFQRKRIGNHSNSNSNSSMK